MVSRPSEVQASTKSRSGKGRRRYATQWSKFGIPVTTTREGSAPRWIICWRKPSLAAQKRSQTLLVPVYVVPESQRGKKGNTRRA